jgi:MFS family permease
MAKKSQKTGMNKLPVICATAFFGMAGGALVAPTLPSIMAAFSVGKQAIGFVMGVYTLSTAICMPFVGFLSDRVGRKTILIPALILNGIAGFGVAVSNRFELVLLFRFIQGIGVAGLMPSAMTLVGDLFEGKQRVRAMGAFSATTGVGSAAAPLMGGLLAGIVWNVPYFIYVLTIPLAVLVARVIPPSTQQENVLPFKTYIVSFFRAPNKARILGILGLGLLSFLLLYSLIIYLPILLTGERFGLTPFWAGLFLAVQGVTSGIAATRAKHFSEKYDRPGILTVGLLLMSCALLSVFFVREIWQLILSLLLFGSGFGTVQPQLNTWITEQVETEQRGGLVAVFNMMKYIGQTTAPLLYGLVLFFLPIQSVFITASIIGVGAAFLALLLRNH